jgi:hypothetical protein
MRVPKACTVCGKPKDAKFGTIAYTTEDDLSESIALVELPTHRAVFCSKDCRVEFIKNMDPDMTPDELLAEVEQQKAQA